MRTCITAPAIIVGLIGLGGCQAAPKYEKPLTPVVVASATSHVEPNGVRYAATIEPNLRVDLAFKVGGYVEGLLQVKGADGHMRDVQDGDRVRRDAVLATVRQTDYTDKRNQAVSQLRQAQVSVDYAKQEFDRAERLFAAKSLTQADRDAAKTKLDVSVAQLDGAKALVQEADSAIADTSLKSPIDGTVMKRLVEVGSLAGPGTPGFVLEDDRQVKVVFGAPDTVVRRLRPGSPQTIVTAAVPDREFHGRITRVAPNADPRSRVFDIEVTIPNGDGLLKVGMVAALQVAEGEPMTAPVVVPLTAIVRSRDNPNGYAVLIVEERDGKQIARSRTIRVGQTFGNAIAITDGLRVGERVIIRGATLVTDGEQVRIAPL
jgi:RND family efflux transporter MFP subunit